MNINEIDQFRYLYKLHSFSYNLQISANFIKLVLMFAPFNGLLDDDLHSSLVLSFERWNLHTEGLMI